MAKTNEELEQAKIKHKVDEMVQEFLFQKYGKRYSLDQIRKQLDPALVEGTQGAAN